VGQHYALWLEEQGCANWRDYFRPPTGTNDDQRWRWDIPEEFHYDRWIAERTNALMTEAAEDDAPFFLWASFFDPHPGYLAPAPWDTMYDPASIDVPVIAPGEHEANPPHFRWTQNRDADWSVWQEPEGNSMHGCGCHLHDRETLAKNTAVYYGMVSLMDKYIGSILDRLEALGLAENTLVVFTTDHGHFLGQHGLIAKGPFHYEDMVRVPFVVRWPGQVPAGRRSDALQTLVDLPTSFLPACGIPTPRTMTGVDQTPVWRGEAESARNHVVVEHHHQPTTIHMKTYVDARHKLTVYWNQPYGELFDLLDDPGEVRNRWDDPAYAGLKAELTRKLLFAEMGKEPMWMPRVAGA
jgi:uncharacterized sulfatase